MKVVKVGLMKELYRDFMEPRLQGWNPPLISIITGQFGDIPSEKLFKVMSEIGYTGLELACGACADDNDPLQCHFDVQLALKDNNYCAAKRDQLDKYGLECYAVSNHCVGQGVLDQIDSRNLTVIPPRLHGDGSPETVWKNCAQEMKDTAWAAAKFGAKVVTGFTGSPIWPYLYSFPPVPQSWIDDGFKLLAERWIPILDEYQKAGVKFALEVHPTEIAFDIHSARMALEAVDYHPAFGFNFDPSHLVWQSVDPIEFINEFSERIYHTHMKDVVVKTASGRNGILGGHLPFAARGRGWDFVSVGRGDVDFYGIYRALQEAKTEWFKDVYKAFANVGKDAQGYDAVRVALEKTADFHWEKDYRSIKDSRSNTPATFWEGVQQAIANHEANPGCSAAREKVSDALFALKHSFELPLSVEWEDSTMFRMVGAAESFSFVEALVSPPSDVDFDGQFGKDA